MKAIKSIIAILLGVSIFFGCSNDDTDDDTILVTSIKIIGENITDGSTSQFSAIIIPRDAEDKTVTWSVSDESIATISSDGLLTAIANGSVKVAAQANDRGALKIEKEVTVSGVMGPVVWVESITLSGSDITDGSFQTISAEVLPADATNKTLVWTVSDETIAEINNEGLLTPKKNGAIKVMATALDGSGVIGELDINISGIYDEVLVAENVLLWQRNNGGWPKEPHNDFSGYEREQSSFEINEAESTKGNLDTNIDNNHTVGEIRILLEAYKNTSNPKYLEAAVKGIDYLFEAQYENGGWPQYYPDTSSYRARITYNDNAMGNVMNLMRDIFLKKNNLEYIDESYVDKAQTAFDKGIEIILQTQIVINGTKTAWCAQHDEVTLAPAKARSYELESVSGSESVGVTRLLMTIETPSAEVIDAVKSAVLWFDKVKIEDYKLQDVTGDEYENGYDKILVESPGNVMWARFYDLETETPFFCSRDGIKKSTIAEITHERRNGYAWYGNWPKNLLSSEYNAWRNKHGI